MTQTSAQRRFSKLAAAINQKARRMRAPGRVTADDLARTFIDSGGRCAYCGIDVVPASVSFDHIVPFAKGGTNFPRNLAVSCITCQRGKFTKTPDEWAYAKDQVVQCEVCKKPFKPRWADWSRGLGRTCSRACSGQKGGTAERVGGAK